MTLVILGFVQPLAVLADEVLPQGGSVVQGGAVISVPGAGQMIINQSSNRAVVNWNSFSIGQGNSVDIRQPSTSSAILNRVTGTTTSEIHGRLSANGQVFVVNPNGIFIGEQGAVSAGGGFVGSTLDTTDENFMAGRLRFEGQGASAAVRNDGRVTIGRGGFAALLGGHVSNAGTVTVPMGRIGLASGEMVTLDVSGDRFLQVAVPTEGDSDEMRALIENAGTVAAEGGLIEMRAATARDAARNAINLSGVAEARSVSRRGGTIILGGGAGGKVRVTGRVTTRPAAAVEKSPRPQARPGGDITITGQAITLQGAKIAVGGDGDGGRINIGGAFQGGDSLPSALTLEVDGDTRITADAGQTGNGGRVILWSDQKTTFDGQISARGGASGGDGGFVEVSGKQTLAFRGLVNTNAPYGATGTLLLDPHNITIADAASFGIGPDGSGYTASGDDAILSVTDLESNLADNNIQVSTGSGGTQDGNITVAAEINWSSFNTLAFNAANDVTLNAGVIGPNGTFRISAGGDITTGAGGAVEVARFDLERGDWIQQGATLPSFSAGDFRLAQAADTSFLRVSGGTGDGDPYLLFDVYGLQGAGSQPLLGRDFALANDIDASGTSDWNDELGFAPIGTPGGNVFSGTLDGRDNTISGLGVNRSVAGLFGATNGAMISNMTLDKLAIAGENMGGLAVLAIDTVIENIQVNGNVDALYPDIVGGIVGELRGAASQLRNSSFSGRVTATNETDSGYSLGGLVGTNAGGTVANSDFSGVIEEQGITDALHSIGGAVGTNRGTVTGVTTAGDMLISGNDGVLLAGGLVADNQSAGVISGADSDISVTLDDVAADQIYAGGVVGRNSGSVAASRTTSAVVVGNADGPVSVGGFAGLNTNTGSISDAMAEGGVDVSVSFYAASGNAYIGGFVGENQGAVTRTAARGAVDSQTGLLSASVGGHTGYNDAGTVLNSYASGAVSSTSDAAHFVGGLVGRTNGGAITSTYASGAVGGAGSGGLTEGGLIGQNAATAVAASYWDTETSGQADGGPGLGLGLTTAEFADTDEFLTTAGDAGWNFDTVWAPGAAGRYPALYAIDRVLFARPDPLALSYGQVPPAATGPVAGGPLAYVFAAPAETIDTAPIFAAPVLAGTAVGTQSYSVATLPLTSSTGQSYAVVARTGRAEISPAALTLTANDATKTYGTELTFAGTEFTLTEGTLFFEDSVDTLTLASDGAADDAPVGGSPYAITADGPVTGTGTDNYDITFVNGALTVDPAPVTLTGTVNDARKPYGTALTFAGTEFTLTGGALLFDDRLDTLTLSSAGAAAGAPIEYSPYAITAGGPVTGTGVDNYAFTFDLADGALTVDPAPVTVPPPDIPVFDLPNPADTLVIPGGGGAVVNIPRDGGTTITGHSPRDTLLLVQEIANTLEIAAANCNESSGDVGRYLACISDALDAFADQLDAISTDLPPGMEDVARIVRDAREGVGRARARALARMAQATTDAERDQIFRDAVNESRAALDTASSEIRKAILLVRADDPELAAVQRATINTVALAIDNVGIQLSRVEEL
ncbi:filamentous hemagglutinin N-terminal domain-containing protein [Phaeovulum sp.]|uniref:two-partner secretion domain-containing protein n=1 Tax=Phaeovulum sp. TaxID=2934796 RepID=UPI0039E66D84